MFLHMMGQAVPCSRDVRPCVATVNGHRKYALRADPADGVNTDEAKIRLLRPPAFIHGDQGEYRLSFESGMYVMHFSRCSLGSPTKGFRAKATKSVSWLEATAGSNAWPIAQLSDLQNESASASLAPCAPVPWSYR